jgi:hypothetical protein
MEGTAPGDLGIVTDSYGLSRLIRGWVMYKISNVENLGKPIGITGLEKPFHSNKESYLCNLCLKPIELKEEVIRAKSTKKVRYYYHLDCATGALLAGKVKISKKRIKQIKQQEQYLINNPLSNLLIAKK